MEYVDLNGKNKPCSMCGNLMHYMGQHGYQKYWDCPEGCGPETEDIQRPDTHCWVKGCGQIIERKYNNADSPYGHKCPVCQCSLRNHPKYGMGAIEDKGIHG